MILERMILGACPGSAGIPACCLASWCCAKTRSSRLGKPGRQGCLRSQDALPGRVLACPADRLLELRIELESQAAFRARQRRLKQSRNAPAHKQSGGTV